MSAIQIVREVADQHLLTVEQLRSRSRLPRIVLARIHAAHRLKQERNLSAAVIGRMLNRTKWQILYYTTPNVRRYSQSRALKYYHDLHSEAA